MIRPLIIIGALGVVTVGGGIGLAVAHHASSGDFVITTRPAPLIRSEPRTESYDPVRGPSVISDWTSTGKDAVTQTQVSALAPLITRRPAERPVERVSAVIAHPNKAAAPAPRLQRGLLRGARSDQRLEPVSPTVPVQSAPNRIPFAPAQTLIGVYR